jgi:hypothetical protein
VAAGAAVILTALAHATNRSNVPRFHTTHNNPADRAAAEKVRVAAEIQMDQGLVAQLNAPRYTHKHALLSVSLACSASCADRAAAKNTCGT